MKAGTLRRQAAVQFINGCRVIARCVWMPAAAFSLCALLGGAIVPVGDAAQAYSAASPASSAIDFYQRYISDLHYGHCRFTPSCSEYARQSIETYGLLEGSALAADRLVRCNSAAGRYYPKDSNGRLVDPVGGVAPTAKGPRVPRVFLPFLDGLYGLPFPCSGDGSVSASRVANRALECWTFGDFLAAHGDCERAATEYLRAVYVALSDSVECGSSMGTDQLSGRVGRDVSQDELIGWSRLKTASCYYRNEQWTDAAVQFQDVLLEGQSSEDSKRLAGVMAAASLFNAGQYEKCGRYLKKWQFVRPDAADSGDSTVEQSNGIDSRKVDYAARAVSVLCDMGCGRWDDASGIESLSSIAQRGRTVQRKNATLAPALSALLPGSGQVYAGRPGDGLRHFILDGLLIYGVVHLIRDEEYWGAYLVGGIAIPFYAGNIMGARAAAEDFNRRKTAAFLGAELRRLESP